MVTAVNMVNICKHAWTCKRKILMKVTNWIYIYFMKNAKMKQNFAKKKFCEKIFREKLIFIVFMNICICESNYGVKGGG